MNNITHLIRTYVAISTESPITTGYIIEPVIRQLYRRISPMVRKETLNFYKQEEEVNRAFITGELTIRIVLEELWKYDDH